MNRCDGLDCAGGRRWRSRSRHGDKPGIASVGRSVIRHAGGTVPKPAGHLLGAAQAGVGNRIPWGLRLACAALCVLAGTAAAEDFDRLLAETLASHPTVEGRRAGRETARFEREGAQWQLYPTPSLEVAGRSSDVVGVGRNSSVFALEQPLWAGGRLAAGVRAAGFREAAAEATILEAKQSIGLRVISAYTEAQRFRAREAHAQIAVAEHERLLALIDRRVQQGVSAPSDRDFASSRLVQAVTDVSVAEQGAQTALGQLAQLVGRSVRVLAPVSMQGRLLPVSVEEGTARALERSPVLARLDQEFRAAGEQVEISRAAPQPQLSVRVERQFGDFADNRALLLLRALPGAGFSAASAISAARGRQQEAQLAREESQRLIREQVHTAYTEWRAAQGRLDNVREAVNLSQSVFDSYSRQYVAGRRTWVDVLNAVREITLAQYTAADAEAQARAAALRLWLLTGEAPLGEADGAPGRGGPR